MNTTTTAAAVQLSAVEGYLTAQAKGLTNGTLADMFYAAFAVEPWGADATAVAETVIRVYAAEVLARGEQTYQDAILADAADALTD